MYYLDSNIIEKYIAYLRHANLCLYSVFYQYAVPTGQKPSLESLNP